MKRISSISLAFSALCLALISFHLGNKAATQPVPQEVRLGFDLWKIEQKRLYASPEEQDYRLRSFYKNWVTVQQSRNQNEYELELNFLADLSEEEFLSKYAMKESFAKKTREALKEALKNQPIEEGEEETPENFNLEGRYGTNWLKDNKMTPVRQQGACGACWAFATTAALESAWLIKNQNPGHLSPQHLIDCVNPSFGCEGGITYDAYVYLLKKKIGIAQEREYPYIQDEGRCERKNSKWRLRNIKIANDSDMSIMNILRGGPLVTHIDAKNLLLYKRGIFNGICSSSYNHGVVLAGAEKVGKDKYWIVKNSWSQRWGEKGYIRIKMGGNCKIVGSFRPIV